jgi:hypothetical protein
MTIKELIEQLQQLDPDLHVFTRGYEDGFEYAELKETSIEMALNYYDDEWWYGPHQLTHRLKNEDKDKYITVKGIIL